LPDGLGNMLCFDLAGGRSAVNRFLHQAPGVPSAVAGQHDDNVQPSGHDVASLRQPAEKQRQGITDGLVRLRGHRGREGRQEGTGEGAGVSSERKALDNVTNARYCQVGPSPGIPRLAAVDRLRVLEEGGRPMPSTPPYWRVLTHQLGDLTIVRPAAKQVTLEEANALWLRDRLVELVEAGHHRLALDLGNVDFLTSTMVEVLLALHPKLIGNWAGACPAQPDRHRWPRSSPCCKLADVLDLRTTPPDSICGTRCPVRKSAVSPQPTRQ